MAMVYFKVMNLFIASSKQFRKMEKDSRALIYSFIKECCAGRDSRFYKGKEEHTSTLLDARLNRFARCKMVVQWSTRWLCHYIDIMANLVRKTTCELQVVLFAALFAVISCRYFGVAPALAGLSLSYAFSMDMLNMFIHALSYLEHYKMSAQRLRDYSSLQSSNYILKEQGRRTELKNRRLISKISLSDIVPIFRWFSKTSPYSLKQERKWRSWAGLAQESHRLLWRCSAWSSLPLDAFSSVANKSKV
ncbi:hypothetical protein PMAYCL1PPCAC_27672 [Pristionchus mayeri]|uniref:ABC transmembrane type-1 domain-containing protein n=1 Tax=Pristionchus mayeri TaxID=1317129 RepID=A0AAN5I9B9_9BILA|nr:hypothetical protein PMAYCL1PPCAC_27672 [Pristionchus mayeri]